MNTTIQIGQLKVGDGQPCFIAAEIGINHNGDMSLAKETIAAAAEAGACAVKFQNYRTEDFLSDPALTYEYLSQGKKIVESQMEMFRRCELNRDQLRELKQYCDQQGVVFFSTPTGEATLQDLREVGSILVKNGSDYLTHLPLIRAMAQSGLPTVLATGMSTLGEIDDAVRAFEEAGGQDLIILHCTSSYPTPDPDVHLRKIPALRAALDRPIGLSDHSHGIVAAVGAVVLGACMVEKHFTLSRDLPGPDHAFSMDPGELKDLVAGIRTVEAQLGSGKVGPTQKEFTGRENYRLSCTLVSDRPAGHALTEADIAMRRPGTGFPPREIHHLVGRRLRMALKGGTMISPENLD